MGRMSTKLGILGAIVQLTTGAALADDYTPQQEARMEYDFMISHIAAERDWLGEEFSPHDSLTPPVIQHLQDRLEGFMIGGILGSWIQEETPWVYNTGPGLGDTRYPQEGSIDCGHFFNYTLQDLGFNIDADALSGQSSESNIMNFVGPEREKRERFSNVSAHDFRDIMLGKERGLYAIGLDCHIGFIYTDGDSLADAIHASYLEPRHVVREPLGKSPVIDNSRYRVIAKLFDDEMVQQWLSNEELPSRVYTGSEIWGN